MVLQFLKVAMTQKTSPQRLGRIPEPTALTEAPGAVSDYDQVMTSKLSLLYAAALEILHRVRPEERGENALDIACGPGHLTVSLARLMNYSKVVGLDLSEPMVRTATRNAVRRGLDKRVQFQKGDATQLSDFPDRSFDLTTYTDAAHHMENLSMVRHVLTAMDRVTRPDGVVMVMDLVRLKTQPQTEQYLDMLASDYIQRGLTHFLADFRNSMYAAWTVEEMREAVPSQSSRRWVQWVPRLFPSMQVLLGLPVNRKEIFVRPAWKVNPLVKELNPLWEKKVGRSWARETRLQASLLRLSLKGGRVEQLHTSPPIPHLGRWPIRSFPPTRIIFLAFAESR